ncbi:MAG: hypothetical protein JSR21_18660, partial [Proteobacteria bacterium]|nr:hypothetical protein [Pseudomonadota bacterium]
MAGLQSGFSGTDLSGAVRAAGAGFLLAAAAAALLAPAWFWPLLAAAAAVSVGFLAFRHTVGFCAGWLLLAGSTPEMFLGDLMGPSAYQAIIALVKALQLGLVALCILRFGPRADPFNPG